MPNGTQMGIRDTKQGWKQAFAESEERNKGLAEYLNVMQTVMKQVLLVAAEKHDELELVITPEGESFKGVLANICAGVAPFCQDVKDIKLPPAAIAQLTAQGGTLVQFGHNTTGEQPEE
jgi:hypothetical protein